MSFFHLTFVLFSLLCYHSPIAQQLRRYRPLRIFEGSQEENHPRIWALLVAGSNGWYNYRHQADICHSFHILRGHGIPEENIITMMYDDIANSAQNPYRGKLYNKPHGPDVYNGVKIDYKGKDVTPQNFIAILQGNASAIRGGNRRVIESNEHDHIFVYFSDHGATGLVAFPDDILTAADLNNTLMRMHKERHYNQLVFYLEACESGSMFKGILPKNIGVYAVTAANSRESSWGYYCNNDMHLPCLGDQFSINWMEDSDIEELEKESLQRQYEIVKAKTNLSHVMHYGDLSIAKEFVADFQGWKKDPRRSTQQTHNFEEPYMSAWPARDVPLLMLQKELDLEDDSIKHAEIQHKITKLQRKRAYLRKFMVKLVREIIHDTSNRRNILSIHPHSISDWKCYDQLLKIFNQKCFNFSKNPYALKYAFILANICEEQINVDLIVNKMLKHCSDIEITGIH